MTPRWSTHLKRLCQEVQVASGGSSEDGLFTDLWLLLHSTISAYIRIHAARLGRVSREDLEDIAAEKSLDLLRKIDRGQWNPTSRTNAEVEGYISMTARNGLIDRRRAERQRVEPTDEERDEWDVCEEGMVELTSQAEPPDLLVERKEYANALRDCVARLDRRGRAIWFLRVLAGMSTKEISVHPEVLLKTGHIDVLLQRARRAVRECMERKGHDPTEIPPGTFTEVWAAFRSPDSAPEGGRQ